MTAIQPGQIYRSLDPRGRPAIRITGYTSGHARAHVVDAVTGKRFRQILVTALHASDRTKTGAPRRTGYALVDAGQDGPTVRECADHDRRWWDGEKSGE